MESFKKDLPIPFGEEAYRRFERLDRALNCNRVLQFSTRDVSGKTESLDRTKECVSSLLPIFMPSIRGIENRSPLGGFVCGFVTTFTLMEECRKSGSRPKSRGNKKRRLL